MSDPEIDAAGFDVSNAQWNPVGIPTLTFQIVYRGPKPSTQVEWEAIDIEGNRHTGKLNGALGKDLSTLTFITLPPGTTELKTLKFKQSAG